MPMTAEDVVRKRFQPTKFKEGYDQREVDDFLDDVVTELRRLTAENEELSTKLEECEKRSGGAGASAPGTAAGASAVEVGQEPAEVGAQDGVASAEGVASGVVTEPADDIEGFDPDAPAVEGRDSPQAAAGMLALAQKLHDDYVRDGQQEGERILSEARERATVLVQDAEEQQERTLGDLDRQRSVLERTIDGLRAFERDYRSRLKAYLEGQLRDLDTAGTVQPAEGPADVGGSADQHG